MKKIFSLAMTSLLVLSMFSMFAPEASATTTVGFVGGDVVKIYDLLNENGGEVLAYAFTNPAFIENPISPYIVPLDENDPLFEGTLSVAEYFHSVGYSVSYSNLAYNLGGGCYSTRLSIRATIDRFEKTFGTTLKYVDDLGYTNVTSMNVPLVIQSILFNVEFAFEVEFFDWPAGWAPPQPSYYHLSPNHEAAEDMDATNWENGPQSVENAVRALEARQIFGYDGEDVNVAVIDTGFSRNHDTTEYYPTETGFHPFYEEYYKNLLENRYVSHVNHGISPDDDGTRSESGHGTAIVSNLLAVAPGITLHFIPGGGGFSYEDTANALSIALGIADLGVLSCSWGRDERLLPNLNVIESMEDTINQIVSNGAIVCFAAGNGGSRAWPACMPNVIAVGGAYLDENGDFQAASYASSFDSSRYLDRHVPDLCGIVGQSPHGILIEMPTQPNSDADVSFNGHGDETTDHDGWLVASGTSSATPQVAGLAAILKQIDSSIDGHRFRYCAEYCARDVSTGQSANGDHADWGYDPATGYGLIDVYHTVSQVLAEMDVPVYHRSPPYDSWHTSSDLNSFAKADQTDSYVHIGKDTGGWYATAGQEVIINNFPGEGSSRQVVNLQIEYDYDIHAGLFGSAEIAVEFMMMDMTTLEMVGRKVVYHDSVGVLDGHHYEPVGLQNYTFNLNWNLEAGHDYRIVIDLNGEVDQPGAVEGEHIVDGHNAAWIKVNRMILEFEPYDIYVPHYHTYSEIETGLRRLENSGIARVYSVGVSVEGRQIWAIKISDDPSVDDENEPDILFAGLHHAREWISAEVPYSLAVGLVQTYESDESTKTLIDNSEIWIIPVLNPDGLEYSQTVDRMWRKNRRDNGDGTFGVDLNRNYGYMWGLDSGSSGDTSDPTYRGPDAFSEPETIAVRDLISDPNKDFQAALSYHSYGQLILYPWGYTDESAPDSSVMSALAAEMSDLILGVHDETYTPQQSSQLYLTSGDLTDWVYGTTGVPAFTVELRPESPDPGFELPESEILDTCEENWPAALYLIRWIVLSQGGFMDFEDGVDEMPIRSTIPGMTFTTTEGYDWVYGDVRTEQYNVNPYGSCYYECHGNFFAWLGPNQGMGRIDFVGATATSISMLTSTYYGTHLEAYDSSASLVDSDYAGQNTQTGTMSELGVSGSDIAYVLVHDTGNYWLIDDLRVRDLLRETSAFQPPDSESMFQTLDTIDMGAMSTFEFNNNRLQTLKILLNWQGSQLGIRILRPDGTVFTEIESDTPPIRIVIPIAEPGNWGIEVTALDIPHDEYPFAIDVASVPLPPDIEPPTTTLDIGSPKFVDASNNVYITSSSTLTLDAIDDTGTGSGVALTGYRYDNGWIEDVPPISFHLEGLDDGIYCIEYNSTDKAGNVEATNSQAVILDNTGPLITVSNPPAGWALQDGTTFTGSIVDSGSGVSSMCFSIREADGGEGIPIGFECLPVSYDPSTGEWSLSFDTLLVPDGYYVLHIETADNLGNQASKTVSYSIRNWAVIELLPSTRNNKAGRTMPVKFALRVAAEVDPNQPFVYNEELRIEIYATADPDRVLQESHYGDTSRDYRISSRHYITNFKTIKRKPMEYTVAIYRDTFDIGSFTFDTVK